MTDDLPFRLALAALFLLLVPVGVYHRVRSQATGERLDRRQEGLFILVSLRLLGFIASLGMLAYLVEPGWMAWSAVPLPAWLRWAGVGLLASGGLLMTWAFVVLGRNLTDTVVTRKEHSLVTSGPYRLVRHPFYVAAALASPASASRRPVGSWPWPGGWSSSCLWSAPPVRRNCWPNGSATSTATTPGGPGGSSPDGVRELVGLTP